MKAIKVKGSLQAAQAIASSIKTLLGPSQSVKCCVNGDDDRDAIICSNAAKILQCLEIEHPVWYIINDACQAMHKTYGCGCTTLVCMIGFWSRSALMLQHEGVPIPIISKLFEEALHNCLQVLEEIAHPIHETLHERRNHVDIQNKLQTDSISTAARLSRTIIEEVWATAEDDISEVDIAQRSDNGLLTTNEPLGYYSLASLDGDADKRETQHFVPKLPNQAQNKTIFLSDSRQSSAFDDKVEDEFDSCFDDLPVNAGKFPKKVINKESEGAVCRSGTSSEGMMCRNNARPMCNTPSNKSELKRMDQMLKDLSFSGQKLMSSKVSTGKRVTEILKSCHNLSINSPKTQREESYQPHDFFPQRSSDLGFIGKEDLGRLGKMLAHGKDKVMDLAIEVIFRQMSPSRKEMDFNIFDVDENAINIERIVGPASQHSQVVNGILLRQEAQLVDYPLVALRIALVNGDITEGYQHTGFKDSFQTKTIFNETSYKEFPINNIPWCQRILSVLQTLNIGVVVARGSIDEDLEECCQALKIQTFSGISSRTFQLLSHSLGSTAVVYLTDLREHHIGRPVFIRHWSGPQPGITNAKRHFLILQLAENQKAAAALPQSGRDTKLKENVKESTEEKVLLQTVLLCGPSEQLVVDLELTFWTCVFRLRNTINCGQVLPGAGKTEISCINKLRQISENPDILKDKPSKSSSWLQVSLPSYRPAVYTAFADGLVEFLVNLLSNSGCMVNYGQALTVVHKALDDHDQQWSRLQYPLIADDFVAKKNAWSKAIGVVRVILQSDMAIVTGSQTSTESVQG